MRHRPRSKNSLLELRERLALLDLAIEALEQYEYRIHGIAPARKVAKPAPVRLKLPVVLRKLGRGAAADRIVARVESATAGAL
ncbi:MAG: hypothetical protein ABL995_18775 [Bryobacteraceae bacterium]